MRAWKVAFVLLVVLLNGSWVHGVAFGPGFPGFLPTCSSTYAVKNLVLQSQSFTTSPWTLFSAGGASNPTVTANTAVAPDSTMTASTLALPAVTSGQSSILYQSVSFSGNQPYVTDIYIKGVVGGETLWFGIEIGGGTGYVTQKIVAATSWQRIPVPFVSANTTLLVQIGVDTRGSSGQTGQSAQSVYIWGAQAIANQVERNYVPTTTSTVTQQQTVNCPPGIAFRDWTALQAGYPGTTTVPQGAGAQWNAGAQGAAFNTGIVIGGVTYAPTYAAPTPYPSSKNFAIGMLSSTNYAGAWSQACTNPIIPLGGDIQTYAITPNMILQVGSSPAKYLLYFSAQSTTYGIQEIYLFTSSDPSNCSGWTAYSSLPVLIGGPEANGASVSLPCVVYIGGQYLMYVTTALSGGEGIFYYTSPNGLPPWTYGGQALMIDANDWDTGGAVEEDAFVNLNKHGFYEMTYAGDVNPTQSIGYAISQDGKIWFKYQPAAILPGSGGSALLGDSNMIEVGNSLYFSYDTSTNSSPYTSSGAVIVIPDH
jgi:hypothetical protein